MTENNIINNFGKIKIAFLVTRCVKCGPIDVVYNIATNLDKNIFEPYIVTLYSENDDSNIKDFINAGISCFCAETNKSKILLRKVNKLESIIEQISPDIIHSHGAFPGIAAMKFKKMYHLITLHCFMREDYISEYGFFIGRLLEMLHMQAVKQADKVLTCSQSLSNKYSKKYNLDFGFVLNGIDFSKYLKINDKSEKVNLRNRLNLPQDKTIFVYAARIIKRKNQVFLCEAFSKLSEDKLLLLLGDGEDFQKLKIKYGSHNNIIFAGYKSNVHDYLCASDVYVSSSKSEGMPLGVIEALACGLPAVLSDIPQHREIIEKCEQIGLVYKSEDVNSCLDCINSISDNYEEYSEIREKAIKYFDARCMSKNYQQEYVSLANNSNK